LWRFPCTSSSAGPHGWRQVIVRDVTGTAAFPGRELIRFEYGHRTGAEEVLIMDPGWVTKYVKSCLRARHGVANRVEVLGRIHRFPLVWHPGQAFTQQLMETIQGGRSGTGRISPVAARTAGSFRK
jgi:hypothetical protein